MLRAPDPQGYVVGVGQTGCAAARYTLGRARVQRSNTAGWPGQWVGSPKWDGKIGEGKSGEKHGGLRCCWLLGTWARGCELPCQGPPSTWRVSVLRSR